MKNNTHEPNSADADTAALPSTPALSEVAAAPPHTFPSPALRHDGWDGEAMAIFCETLADTAVVAEACAAARKSTNTAYALRRRNPFFAAAWDSALAVARERLADTLLARSIEGNIEQIWRDGELVGERHVIDNRLGLAILRRLDRLAEAEKAAPAPAAVTLAPRSKPFDWELMVSALRSGEPDAIAAALAEAEGDETHEAHDPPFFQQREQEDEELDLSHRCWLEGDSHAGLPGGQSASSHDADLRRWMTDFPPPEGFSGYESRGYGEDSATSYERECTADEAALLDADCAAFAAQQRADEEALRDSWFTMLKEENVARHCRSSFSSGLHKRLGWFAVERTSEKAERLRDRIWPRALRPVKAGYDHRSLPFHDGNGAPFKCVAIDRVSRARRAPERQCRQTRA